MAKNVRTFRFTEFEDLASSTGGDRAYRLGGTFFSGFSAATNAQVTISRIRLQFYMTMQTSNSTTATLTDGGRFSWGVITTNNAGTGDPVPPPFPPDQAPNIDWQLAGVARPVLTERNINIGTTIYEPMERGLLDVQAQRGVPADTTSGVFLVMGFRNSGGGFDTIGWGASIYSLVVHLSLI